MKQYHKFWDAVYVINLDFRQDRWDSISKMAEAAELHIERFDAVKAVDIDLAKHRIGTRVKKQSCIACTMSHFNIYRDALAKGYNKVLILEDDADVPVDFYEQVENLFETNDLSDFDLLYLGCADKYPNVPVSDNLAISQFSLLTHALLFTRQGMEKVINWVDTADDGKCRMTIDVFLAETLQPFNKTYQAVPAIVTTITSHSDLAGWKRTWSSMLSDCKHQGLKNPKKWAHFEERAKIIKKENNRQLL